jgi:hypothetical protein
MGVSVVIGSSRQLEDFDRWYAASELARLSYSDALANFSGLWRYARQINEDFPTCWKEDIEADIELARVLNSVVDPA